MRELRPLHLPKIVADRKSASRSTEDVTTKPMMCTHSSAGSFSSASDVSAPTTPTFSLRGHSRFPSASSSLTSTSASPICEHGDMLGSATKLVMPQLPEEPAENEEEFYPQRDSYEDAFDLYKFDDVDRTTILYRESFEFGSRLPSGSSEMAPLRELRRQQSMDTTLSNISVRLNSFTTRFRSRKNSALPAGLGIQTTNLTRPPSSRSSSVASSYFANFDQNEISPTPAMSIRASNSTPGSPIDETERLHVGEPFDRRALSSTPLLPPMMTAPAEDAVDAVQSPLQSPAIADPDKTFSIVSSTAEISQISVLPSPELSTKPSIASFHRGRTSTLASVADVPPLHIVESTDEWSLKLGHANFVIEPAPYIPDVCDAETCRLLVVDWETARQQYFKHRARTVEHYGANSKTYKLTEEKWLSIDAEWRSNNAIASAQASLESTDASPVIPTEPAPLTSMPALTDSRCDGKFPKLGDLDIVGPMEVAPPLPQTSPPSPTAKLSTFFRSMFVRSRSATR